MCDRILTPLSRYEEGWLSALEQLASTTNALSASGAKPSLWSKMAENLAKAILGAYRVTSNIHSSLNPHLMVSE